MTLGLAFAVCARDRIRADGSFAMPSFAVVLSFAGIVLLPMSLYLFLWHAAWAWMYLFDPDLLPILALIPLAVAHAGLLIVGYYLGGRLMKRGNARMGLYFCAAGAAIILIGSATAWKTVGRVGTFAEFRDKRALPIMEVKLGYVMVAMVLGIAVAAGFSMIELLRDSRRVRSR